MSVIVQEGPKVTHVTVYKGRCGSCNVDLGLSLDRGLTVKGVAEHGIRALESQMHPHPSRLEIHAIDLSILDFTREWEEAG